MPEETGAYEEAVPGPSPSPAARQLGQLLRHNYDLQVTWTAFLTLALVGIPGLLLLWLLYAHFLFSVLFPGQPFWGAAFGSFELLVRVYGIVTLILFIFGLQQRIGLLPVHRTYLAELLTSRGILLQLMSDQVPHERGRSERSDVLNWIEDSISGQPLHKRLLWLLRHFKRLCQARQLDYFPPEYRGRKLGSELAAWHFAALTPLVPLAIILSLPLISGASPSSAVLFGLLLIPALLTLLILRNFLNWLDTIALRMALRDLLLADSAEAEPGAVEAG